MHIYLPILRVLRCMSDLYVHCELSCIQPSILKLAAQTQDDSLNFRYQIVDSALDS